METRDIIEQTLKNMGLIYNDVSQIGQLIEEKMKNRGFEAIGDSAFTWETSGALGRPDSWLYKYFARIYTDDESPKKAVGLCIHLGEYEINDMKKFAKFSIRFPIIAVSLLKMDQEVKKLWRTDLYDCLWCAGWYDSYVCLQKISNNRVVYGGVNDKEIRGEMVTYFLDLLTLMKAELVEQLVIEPMEKMFKGDEEWVVKCDLEVLQLAEHL